MFKAGDIVRLLHLQYDGNGERMPLGSYYSVIHPVSSLEDELYISLKEYPDMHYYFGAWAFEKVTDGELTDLEIFIYGLK